MAYFICVDTETEVVYELIAKPVQEPPAGDQQSGEVVEPAPEEITNSADLQDKPPEHIPYFKYSMFYLKYCAFMFKELIGTIDA